MRGIRARTVLGATIALAIALLAGALILRTQLRHSLYSSISEEALTEAQGVAALVSTGRFGPVLASRQSTTQGWVQVVDNAGRVVSATANVRELTAPFAPIGSSTGTSVRRLAGLPIDTGERVAVAAVPVSSGQHRLTVLAARPLDIADASDRRLLVGLLTVFPILLLVAALTVWLVVRRALRPVEAIRSRVASISSSDLSQRVPEPATDDEIGRLATTMNTMLERLQVAVDRQRRFVGDASHELRSPLASLRSQLEVSTVDNPDPAWALTVGDMLREHDRIEALVQDLLLLARYDDRELPEFEPLDLGYLVRTELASRPGRDGVARTVHAENALVMGDTGALERVLRNLVDNAERHAASAVEIRLALIAAEPSAFVDLTVSDDGPGIPTEFRTAVFERFRRLDEARTPDVGGTGLGLAIVADIVHAHQGVVSVEPTPSGARFRVRLPALVVTEIG